MTIDLIITPVTAAAAALVLLRLAGSLALSALNRGEVRRHADAPPAALAATMDDATYGKAVAYTLAKSRFGSVAEIFEAAVLLAALGSGLLPRLYRWTDGWGAPGAAWTGAAFIFMVLALLAAAGLPLEAWEQFRIERRFGFNRMTAALWLADQARHLALGAAIGCPMLWVLLVFARRAGPAWWIWAVGLVFAVQLAIVIVYPRLILPLFNRLSPLPEGELRARLAGLGERTGFRAGRIEVIDGSRRSGHSNAFFTGFGRFRRIVLYDTLVDRLSPVELEAVLAHEIGHYRRGHVPKQIALSAVGLTVAFGAAAGLLRAPALAAGFRFPAGAEAPVFLLLGLLGGTVGFWLSPLTRILSRKYEYEADAFARDALGDAGPLVSALRRLAEQNLSNLTPHPAYRAFHHSHPTPIEREGALLTNGRSRPAPTPG